MEPKDIMQFYISLCNTNPGFLQYHLAPNAVVDWFGRTISKHNKVLQHYRYDICNLYEHIFENAKDCTPFEYKSTHTKTKYLAGVDKTETAFKMSKTKDLTLPKDINSINIMKTKQVECCDLEINKEVSYQNVSEITPPRETLEIVEPLPKKYKKNEKKYDDHIAMEYINNTECRYIDNMLSSKFHKEFPTCKTKKFLENYDLESNNSFDHLKHIESIGHLVRRKSEHHKETCLNVKTFNHCGFEITKCDCCGRKVKLKLSYRIRLSDNTIHFALIVYENLISTSSARKRLFAEFDNLKIVK